MSRKADRNSKSNRKLCADCGQRPAKFRRPNGKYAYRSDHDLCVGCHGRHRDRNRVVRPKAPRTTAFDQAIEAAVWSPDVPIKVGQD